MPGLNPKYLRSAYDMNAYVLVIAIRPSDGDVKPGAPLGSFRKEKANVGTMFPLHPPSPHIHTHTLEHSNSSQTPYTYSYTSSSNIRQSGVEIERSQFRLYTIAAESKSLGCHKGGHQGCQTKLKAGPEIYCEFKKNKQAITTSF